MSTPETPDAPPATPEEQALAEAARLSEMVGEGKKPVTIPLEDPVKHGATLLESITLQPLKGRHLRKLPVSTDNMTIGDVMAIAAVQSQLPDSVIDELCPADLAELLGVTNAFLSLVQGTGRNS